MQYRSLEKLYAHAQGETNEPTNVYNLAQYKYTVRIVLLFEALSSNRSLENLVVLEFAMDSYSDYSDSDEESYSGFSQDEHEEISKICIAEDKLFEVLSTEDILQHMSDSVTEVNQIVDIPATYVRMLLHYFQWNKQQLVERLCDDDLEKLFSEACVINPFTKRSEVISSHYSDTTEKCGICLESCSIDLTTGMECGHRFCTDCWSEYLTRKIMKERESETIVCAGYDCHFLVDDANIKKFVKDSKVIQRYEQLLTNCFVQCTRILRWCPAPDCNNAIKVKHVARNPVSVTCKCNHTFCFGCGENAHEPIQCDLLRKWTEKLNDHSSNLNLDLEYLNCHTKKCPTCRVIIEKEDGCQHMFCRNCKKEFCWLCLQSWPKKEFHECYEKDTPKDPIAVNNNKTDLDRYAFYRNLYIDQKQSLKDDEQLYRTLKTEIEQLQMRNVPIDEIVFRSKRLEKAAVILSFSRRTLMYTHVLSYYLKNNNKKILLEHHLEQLEKAIVTLTEYLKRDLTYSYTTHKNLKICDLYEICDRRSKVLIQYVYEGYEQNWWVHLDTY